MSVTEAITHLRSVQDIIEDMLNRECDNEDLEWMYSVERQLESIIYGDN